MDMEPPVTPKPMPASAAKLPLDHTNKLFGIVYITLTGVIDTIVPAASPWLWVGKSMSYLITLAPILWWALLTQSATRQFPNTSKPANQGWFPDFMHWEWLSPKAQHMWLWNIVVLYQLVATHAFGDYVEATTHHVPEEPEESTQ
ncbi:hypothetical protein DSO57_1001455 [Entomophthora muscae]|uniref:Uncharacterized protein n=1 Tax=Entomophthora muscae TaxID=34485 RepID=A0ACC2UI05_9FUNG|nr:hypothetical protein DSO57_1001455 [Entomophthora muscae]